MATGEIDTRRLLRRIDEMAAIGADSAGGVTRLALSDADKRGRDLLAGWLHAAGLEVRVDDGGNICGLTPTGREPPVLLGSHIDTVRNGGRYDGVLGVVAGLEAVQALAGRTRHRLGVVAFTNEEGARFRPALLGSSLAVGALTAEEVHARRDDDGVPFGAELQRIGYLGSPTARPHRAKAYVELHVEQGPVLEQERRRIGIVAGIIGMRWYDVTVRGAAGHAGATPMAMRRDALVAAAAMIGEIRRAATATDGLLATVGRCRVEPDVQNVIPAKVSFSIDLRSASAEALVGGEQALRGRLAGRAAEQGCELEVQTIWDSPAVSFDPGVRRRIAQAAAELGAAGLELWSGPSHDARMMATVAPTGMIFVPSAGGISHSPLEHTSESDLVLGARVLLATAQGLDAEDGDA